MTGAEELKRTNRSNNWIKSEMVNKNIRLLLMQAPRVAAVVEVVQANVMREDRWTRIILICVHLRFKTETSWF